MQERVAILTITAKPYQEGSAVSHAVLCNPTILWGDLEIKKQGKVCQVKITYFFCNFMMHAMSGSAVSQVVLCNPIILWG